MIDFPLTFDPSIFVDIFIIPKIIYYAIWLWFGLAFTKANLFLFLSMALVRIYRTTVKKFIPWITICSTILQLAIYIFLPINTYSFLCFTIDMFTDRIIDLLYEYFPKHHKSIGILGMILSLIWFVMVYYAPVAYGNTYRGAAEFLEITPQSVLLFTVAYLQAIKIAYLSGNYFFWLISIDSATLSHALAIYSAK
jgi:hypothetical protein